jgi:putative membrane protein
MDDGKEKTPALKVHNRRVHMANERTFLAWVRTSIGIMAFGFVVERFSLFVRQVSYLLGKQPGMEVHAFPSIAGYSVTGLLGIFLVGTGTVMGLFAYFHYQDVFRQIEEDVYAPSRKLPLALTILVAFVGAILLVYLIRSVERQ